MNDTCPCCAFLLLALPGGAVMGWETTRKNVHHFYQLSEKRSKLERNFNEQNWWLSFQEYPSFRGCNDSGTPCTLIYKVSLHQSANSDLHIPCMKPNSFNYGNFLPFFEIIDKNDYCSMWYPINDECRTWRISISLKRMCDENLILATLRRIDWKSKLNMLKCDLKINSTLISTNHCVANERVNEFSYCSVSREWLIVEGMLNDWHFSLSFTRQCCIDYWLVLLDERISKRY